MSREAAATQWKSLEILGNMLQYVAAHLGEWSSAPVPQVSEIKRK
jgi:hypothetical protein